MGLMDFFKQNEALIAIDIGAGGIKLLELDLDGEQPKLLNLVLSPIKEDIFASNLISKTDLVAERIGALLEANGITDRRVVTAMPGPTVFTKKVKMVKVPPAELTAQVQMEAGSFIPHNVDAVKIDFHVCGQVGKNQLEVLVVAVKNEVINSFSNCLALAGLEPAVIDTDYFALQNCFEFNYPELIEETCALINLGARYSSITICRGGTALFTGDIAVGGRMFTEAIAAAQKLPLAEAEALKLNSAGNYPTGISEALDQKLEYAAAEFNRQLSLFWNASGAEQGISKLIISGGGALVPGLLEELSEKTGIECLRMDPFKRIDCGQGFDPQHLSALAPFMAVSVGLGLRQPGDKVWEY